ncbi:MAG: hypothetical protein JW821_07195 [Deltaproteobacteria bacterium]|nr:hypothetical protein [Deltaproteobacteria bacterium]
MDRSKNISAVLTLLLALLVLAGCATQGKPSVKTACDADIEWQIAPEAEITQFDCKIGTYQKEPALVFTTGVKNISDKPLRFRLNIFLLDMDKGAGHLVPHKGKPPVLEPGKVGTVEVPFSKTSALAKKILVVVKTVGY